MGYAFDWTKRRKKYTRKVFIAHNRVVGHCTCDINFYLGCGCPSVTDEGVIAVYRVYKARHEKSNESWWAGEEVLTLSENEYGKQYIAAYGYKEGVLEAFKKEHGEIWKQKICAMVDTYFKEQVIDWTR